VIPFVGRESCVMFAGLARRRRPPWCSPSCVKFEGIGWFTDRSGFGGSMSRKGALAKPTYSGLISSEGLPLPWGFAGMGRLIFVPMSSR
jgi:hypothetical protein